MFTHPHIHNTQMFTHMRFLLTCMHTRRLRACLSQAEEENNAMKNARDNVSATCKVSQTGVEGDAGKDAIKTQKRLNDEIEQLKEEMKVSKDKLNKAESENERIQMETDSKRRNSSETARLQVVITTHRTTTHTIEFSDMYSYEHASSVCLYSLRTRCSIPTWGFRQLALHPAITSPPRLTPSPLFLCSHPLPPLSLFCIHSFSPSYVLSLIHSYTLPPPSGEQRKKREIK